MATNPDLTFATKTTGKKGKVFAQLVKNDPATPHHHIGNVGKADLAKQLMDITAANDTKNFREGR